MKKYLFVALSSFLAGCCIVFGATCYLVCASTGMFALKLAGASLFGIGLFIIIHYGLWLYTGKVGYLLDNRNLQYVIKLVICLVFNLIGVILCTLLLRVTPLGDTLKTICQTIVAGKQNEKWYQVLILGFFCGIMIYLAVDGHKKAPYNGAKILFAFLPIILFILCGFEHVVANACYYTYAGVFNGKTVLWFLLMAIGDGLGSICFDGILKLHEKLKKEN